MSFIGFDYETREFRCLIRMRLVSFSGFDYETRKFCCLIRMRFVSFVGFDYETEDSVFARLGCN